MTEIIKHEYQFKRGTAAKWAELNPVLRQGEPGFAYDQNKFKIGDGFTPWNALPYIEGANGLVTVDPHEGFPEVGDPTVIYRDVEGKTLYQYNMATGEYESLNNVEIDVSSITIINGGSAFGG